MKSNVETMIENLVQAVHGDKTAREQFLLRESLRNLVRLAKAEQMLEIKSSVATLTRGAAENAAKRKAKIDGMLKLTLASDFLQQRLEFGDDREARALTSRAKLHGARHGN
jgi:hypothetical protein